MSVIIGMSAAPVSAGTKTYLSLWQRCTATGGAASMTAVRPPILYPFSGDQEARQYTTCYQGQRGWGSINGGAANYCNSFNIAAYQIGCYGGTVSGPAFFAGFGQQMRANKLSLSGDTLYIEQSPGIMVVPLQSGAMERAMAAAKRLSPLASGYAPLPPEGSFRTIAWDDARGIPLIPVSGPGELPPAFSLPPAPDWVAALSNPILFYGLVGIIIAYAVVAAFGFVTTPSTPGAGFRLAVLAAIAIGGLVAASSAKDIPANAVAVANRHLAELRAGVREVEQDRNQLRSLVYERGSFAPLTEQSLQQIARLTRPRSFAAPAAPTANAGFWAGVYLAPSGLLLVLFALQFAAGWYYLFVRPPVWGVVRRALRRGKPVDMKAAKAALAPDVNEARNPPPAHQSESDAIRLDTLTEQIENAPISRQRPSPDRQSSVLKKIRAATRLIGALRRRHVEEDRTTSPLPGTSDAGRHLDAQIAAARRRAEQGQRAYEDELRRSEPQRRN